eukprot:6086518-Lingulodinium_polyedra.AAC.1
MRLKKAGWAFPAEQWAATKGYSAKRAFAMRLAMDREGSWLKVIEQEVLQKESSKATASGWLHIWEIADLEKFPYMPDSENMMAKLMKFVANVPSRPSEKPELASAGELQYDYSKRMVNMEV